jgi:hypothetical protein
MPKRLIITKVCFHVVAAWCLLGAIAMLVAMGPLREMASELTGSNSDPDLAPVLGVIRATAGPMLVATVAVGLAGVLGLELLIRGLSRRRYWAWVVSLVVSGFLIFGSVHSYGVTLIVGGLSLWGLVDPDTVAAFKLGPSENRATTDA